ncbi:General transcription factor II-I repeat domain-containing protein 2A [Eumeta japonica]|uniref:General transcription factor II-I repeat domain-containing protein 2A n=1 Tax=Eumeta variegata TaxID=151549 RepID=A0A4C1Y6V5_EUMVA|nr:General transcription factor II-I repeat domain-containing protein 2A [Eumeta japonica]
MSFVRVQLTNSLSSKRAKRSITSKTTLTDHMAGFKSFSIALDENIDLSDTAQLSIFIRGVDKEFTVTKELIVLQPLKGTTTGEDIVNEVHKVFTSFGLPWSKSVGVYTDGVYLLWLAYIKVSSEI